MTNQVLIIDDSPEIARLIKTNLEQYGYQATTVHRGEHALTIVQEGFTGLVILDLNLPDYKELELFQKLRTENGDLPIVIITAHGTIDLAIEAIRLGAYDFMTKSESFLERISVSAKNAFAQLELHSKLEQLSSELRDRHGFDQLVTASDTMKPVFELLTHAVDSRVTVLIMGESGTGKELVARALHYNGPRNASPFVAVNCAGIPDSLLESELFGFEKGAFTGAVRMKRGKFELANRGTLFLDEIGEMPMMLQSKLLRAIQERTIERLGGTSTIPLDIRVVCATNRDLQTEVQSGRFREDLFYRLNVFPIRLPPLRERQGDVPLLARHFLHRAAEEERKELINFEPAALELLESYDYPGNIRELSNIISHASVVASGPNVKAQDLPAWMQQRSGQVTRSSTNLKTALDDQIKSKRDIPRLEDVEAWLIEQAIATCGGSLSEAAELLGISRATIYRRVGKTRGAIH
jgi:two-component system NtrC family response regulator